MPPRSRRFGAVIAVLIAPLAAAAVARAEAPAPYRSQTGLRQLQQDFIDLRFGMFVHFNMATMQDREWGDPRGPIDAFAPASLDTDQWAECAVSAGMRYGCLTTKHHDGFCLWPTESGGDGVGKTREPVDVVRAFVDSFRAKGLRVGLYYSILDLRGDIRHHNVTAADIERIKLELTELLTGYGPIDFLIFDGWDAPWSRITYEEVPFDEVYRLVKEHQPDCLVADLNAGAYPASALYYSDIKSYEQNAGQTVPRGSEVPALSCVTLSDGWFWKSWDDESDLKPAELVVDEWLLPLNSRYCNLICNAAPNSTGRFSPNLVSRLKEIGALIESKGELPATPTVRETPVITTTNLATGRPIRSTGDPDTVGPDLANDGSFGSTWRPPLGAEEASLEIEMAPETGFNRVVIVEPIGRWGDYAESRIASYRVEVLAGGEWTELSASESSEPVRIEAFERVEVDRVRVSITPASPQAEPHIAEIGVYDEPGRQ